MPAHIGIVAGSAEGAALCYRTICTEGAALLGTHAHPEVSIALDDAAVADFLLFDHKTDPRATTSCCSPLGRRRPGAGSADPGRK